VPFIYFLTLIFVKCNSSCMLMKFVRYKLLSVILRLLFPILKLFIYVFVFVCVVVATFNNAGCVMLNEVGPTWWIVLKRRLLCNLYVEMVPRRSTGHHDICIITYWTYQMAMDRFRHFYSLIVESFLYWCASHDCPCFLPRTFESLFVTLDQHLWPSSKIILYVITTLMVNQILLLIPP